MNSRTTVKDRFIATFERNFCRQEAQDHAGKVAFELELLLRKVLQNGGWKYLPLAPALLAYIRREFPTIASSFKDEWSLGQMEISTAIFSRDEAAVDALMQLVSIAKSVASSRGWNLAAHEFISPEEESFDDGQGGLTFVNNYSPRCMAHAIAHPDRVDAMLRPMSLQPSFGMGDVDQMIRAFNAVMAKMKEWLADPTWIHPGRLATQESHVFPKGWTTLASKWTTLRDLSDLFDLYSSFGCEGNPKAFYGPVRPCDRYARLEIRFPGATTDSDKMLWIVKELRSTMGLPEPEVESDPATGIELHAH